MASISRAGRLNSPASRRRRQKPVEQNLDIGGHRVEAGEKGAVFVVHCVINQRFRDPAGSYIWSYIYGITMGPIGKGYLWPTTS